VLGAAALSTRAFARGESGNPKERPKSRKVAPASTFAIVMDRTLTVTQDGKPRELTVEEALQQKTYQDAIGGDRAAQRQIMKTIAQRDAWFAVMKPSYQPPERLIEPVDPENADQALILLGIADRDTRWGFPSDNQNRLRLRPTAVQEALRTFRFCRRQFACDCDRPSVAAGAGRWFRRRSGRHSARESCSKRHVMMMISLSFLAPDLVRAALEGPAATRH
jgi:hypothetical protein